LPSAAAALRVDSAAGETQSLLIKYLGRKFQVERSELWKCIPEETGLNPVLSMENEIEDTSVQ